MDRVVLGRVEEISSREGECLQIRPKAANAAARRLAIDAIDARSTLLPSREEDPPAEGDAVQQVQAWPGRAGAGSCVVPLQDRGGEAFPVIS